MRSTYSSSTRRPKCPLQTCWRCHRRRRLSSCSAILNNSINPHRALIRTAWTRPRSIICWMVTKPSPRIRGLFLEETWRLHPAICAFTSELFYENRLHPRQGLELQEVRSTSVLRGAGLRYLPVAHTGNQSSSLEEAEFISSLVSDFLTSNPTWINREGLESPLTPADILVIAPYNAQVFELQTRLAGVRIGTVDKFQGQEAPVVIYSMTTSTHADAPRGMEFLYSLNRTQCRHFPRPMPLCSGRLAYGVRSGLSHTGTNATRQRILSVPGIGPAAHAAESRRERGLWCV